MIKMSKLNGLINTSNSLLLRFSIYFILTLVPFLLISLTIISFFNKNTYAVFIHILFLCLYFFREKDSNSNLVLAFAGIPLISSIPFMVPNFMHDFANAVFDPKIGYVILSVSLFSFCLGTSIPVLYNYFYPPFSPPNPILFSDPIDITPSNDPTHLIIPVPSSIPDPNLLSIDIQNLKHISLEAYSYIFHTVKPILKLNYKLVVSSSYPRNDKLVLVSKIKQAEKDCNAILDGIQETIDNLNMSEDITPFIPEETSKPLIYDPNVQPSISEAIITNPSSTTSVNETSTSFTQQIVDFCSSFLSG